MKRVSRKILLTTAGIVSVAAISMTVLLQNGITAKVESAWEKVCEESDKDVCSIVQKQFLTKEVDGKKQAVGQILSLAVVYVKDETGDKRPYMSLSMPLGVDLRPGALMRIDEGKEIPLAFLQCTQAGCASSIQLDDALLKEMKRGDNIDVGFLPWGSTGTQAVKASLGGFTKALRSIRP
jgi:invasion protein IalB